MISVPFNCLEFSLSNDWGLRVNWDLVTDWKDESSLPSMKWTSPLDVVSNWCFSPSPNYLCFSWLVVIKCLVLSSDKGKEPYLSLFVSSTLNILFGLFYLINCLLASVSIAKLSYPNSKWLFVRSFFISFAFCWLKGSVCILYS